MHCDLDFADIILVQGHDTCTNINHGRTADPAIFYGGRVQTKLNFPGGGELVNKHCLRPNFT